MALCNGCLGTNILYPVWLKQTPDGNFDHESGVHDHVDGLLPKCLDCNGECVPLDEFYDVDRIEELRAELRRQG